MQYTFTLIYVHMFHTDNLSGVCRHMISVKPLVQNSASTSAAGSPLSDFSKTFARSCSS